MNFRYMPLLISIIGSPSTNFLNLILLISKLSEITTIVVITIAEIEANSGDSCEPNAILTAIDPRVIPTIKSKNVILDISFLPNFFEHSLNLDFKIAIHDICKKFVEIYFPTNFY